MKSMFRFVLCVFSFVIGFGSRAFAQPVPPANLPAPRAAPTPTAPTNLSAVTVVAQNQLPTAIASLGSEAQLFSYALSTAVWARVWVNSNAQVSSIDVPPIRLSGLGVTLAEVQAAIIAAQVSLKITSAEQVNYSVHLQDASNNLSLWGYDYKTPVLPKSPLAGTTESGGGGGGGVNISTPVPFKVNLQLMDYTLVLWKGLRSVKITTFDDAGRVRDGFMLNIDDKGYYFPTGAAGRVLIEITEIDPATGKDMTKVFDLRKKAKANIIPLATTVTLSGKNYVEVKDKDVILVPMTAGGVGDNVLGCLIQTQVRDVSVAARTIENINATGFRWRQIDSTSDSSWKQTALKADTNGMVLLNQLPVGKYHFEPVFPEGACVPAPYTNIHYGKG